MTSSIGSTGALEETIEYLASADARDAVAADPYWPKWDSPWWRMTLLWELGLAHRIPGRIVEIMTQALKRYVAEMPYTDDEVPPGKDPARDVPCHCALGTMHQVLSACGADVDGELPWARRWLLAGQLPDGGLNCDGRAYLGSRKGSVVSTLPALEAILLGRGPHTEEELAFLDRGAEYLLQHRLFKSMSGRVLDPDWLRLGFPRFYKYDVLRGLSYLARWARLRARGPLPKQPLAEAVAAVESHLDEERIVLRRDARAGQDTLRRQPGGAWTKGPAESFPLLDAVAAPGTPSPVLTALWSETLATLRAR